MTVRFATFEERPDLVERWLAMPEEVWPPEMEFIHHDRGVNELCSRLKTEFAAYQFLAIDDDETVLAEGRSIPFRWTGENASLPDGMPLVMHSGFAEQSEGIASTALCALLVGIFPSARSRGLSGQMLVHMKEIAARHHLRWVVAPVRPSEKARYPLVPMERYAQWRRSDGQLSDPWLRIHERVGGRFAGIAPAGNVFMGSVAEWQEWTGLTIPETGEYVVSGALNPVQIDITRNVGVLTEPNVWMVHAVAAEG